MGIPAEIAEYLTRDTACYQPSVSVAESLLFGEPIPDDQIAAALEIANGLGQRLSGPVECRSIADYLDAGGNEHSVDLDQATPEQLNAARSLALLRIAALNQEATELATQYAVLTHRAAGTGLDVVDGNR